MRHYVRLVMFITPLSFLLGVWWSFYRFESQNLRPDYSEGTLHILANLNTISGNAISDFERLYKVKVLLTQKSTDLKFINELYSNGDRYDVVQLNSLQINTIVLPNTFLKLKPKLIPAIAQISPDFLGLEYDLNNEFVLPFSWGINGFITHAKHWDKPLNKLKPILETKKLAGKISLMPNPIEFLIQLKRHGNFSDEWLRIEAKDRLSASLKDFSRSIYKEKIQTGIRSLEQNEILLQQYPSGKSVPYLQRNSELKYWIPKDKATLWVNLLAISHRARRKKIAHDFINHMLSTRAALLAAIEDHSASVITPANDLNIDPMLKPSYIRKIDISRLELVTKHEAFESLWTKALTSFFPNIFPKNHKPLKLNEENSEIPKE